MTRTGLITILAVAAFALLSRCSLCAGQYLYPDTNIHTREESD